MAFPEANYTLGSYRLYFDKFLPGTKTSEGGQRYFGHTTEINKSVESEKLDHFNTDNGIRYKDDTALLQINRTGSFVTDHISPDNLAFFFLGAPSVVVQSAATAQVYNINDVKKNRRYQLGQTAGAPSGVRGITSVVVTSNPIGTTYVAGVDYNVNAATGGLVIPDTSTIPADGDIIVTYNVTATSYNRVVTASDAQLYGAMFIEAMSTKGEKFDFYMPYVSLMPDGDFELKAEEWQTLPFSYEVLKLNDATESIYINGRPGSGI